MSTDPIDLDAIERMAAGSHDPVMALQARALVAEVRQLRGKLEQLRKVGHSWVPTDRLNDYRRHHQVAALRWAAERTNCLDDSETLRSMADHIAAGDVEVPDE